MKLWQPKLALALVLLIGLAHVWLYKLPFEDAYITFRYVQNLVSGHGMVYNPGERVEGCSSVGWVLLLAAVARLGFALPVAAQVLSIGFGLLLIWLTVYMARRFLPELGHWALGAGLLVAAHGTFAYYTASGMETPLFALLLNLALLCAASEGPHAGWSSGALLGAAALVRPEAPGYFALVALCLWLKARREGEQGRMKGELVGLCAAFAAVFVPFFAWRLSYYGYPFPNTFYAKARVGPSGLVTGIEHVEEFLTLGLFWLVPLGLVLLAKSHERTRFWWLSLAFSAGATLNVIIIGGDSFCFYRCFLPALPTGAVISMGGLHVLHQRYAGRLRPWHAPAIAAGLVASVFGASWLPRSTLISDRVSSNRAIIVSVDETNRGYFAIGRWLRANFPKNTLIATNAAGIIPYESGLTTIDMLGLNDAHIAHHKVPDQGAIGHQKHDATYVLQRRPQVILPVIPIFDDHKPGPQELVGTIQGWFGSLPGDQELFDHPKLAEDYLLVTVPVEREGWLTLYLRKDAPKPPGLAP